MIHPNRKFADWDEVLKQEFNPRIKIKANYSFWRHPIKWWRERKARKFLEEISNWQIEHGMAHKLQKKMNELMITGRTTVNGKTYFYGKK